jgi:hypothetical protein
MPLHEGFIPDFRMALNEDVDDILEILQQAGTLGDSIEQLVGATSLRRLLRPLEDRD